jgi:hypothetical protein
MAKVKQTWPITAFDAVGIRANQGTFVIHGIDGDEVILEGDFAVKYPRKLNFGPEGRWLKLYSTWQHGDSQFTLQLPKSKVWTIDIFSGRAEVKIDNIQARSHLWLGKGDAHVENCRGTFSITSGNANVRMRHFTETETTAIPPLPREEHHINIEEPESWGEWEEWAEWGGEFGEKFLRKFFGETGWSNRGLNIQVGKGDVNLEDIDIKSCYLRTARGDARIKQGRIGAFDMKIIAGDVVCESCLPAGDWLIRANRGDLLLTLPSDTVARLDITTRHGGIQSKTPMVRVTRQGPESWHGNRMVGSIGAKTDGKVPEIDISKLNGDIEIKTESTRSPYYNTSEKEQTMTTNPASPTDAGYHSELEILTALGDGKINVAEAERLLREQKK